MASSRNVSSIIVVLLVLPMIFDCFEIKHASAINDFITIILFAVILLIRPKMLSTIFENYCSLSILFIFIIAEHSPSFLLNGDNTCFRQCFNVSAPPPRHSGDFVSAICFMSAAAQNELFHLLGIFDYTAGKWLDE